MIYRVVIPRDLWTTAFAELSVARHPMAWGQIHRSYHDHYCDLIVRRLLFTRTLPTGNEHAPVFDWILLDSPQFVDAGHAAQRIQASQVQNGQLFAYLQVGLGNNLDQWIGAVTHVGQCMPIQKIMLVGSRMDSFSRKSSSTNPPKSPSVQWSRIAGGMGNELFRRFRSQSPLIIGSGRLGSLVAESLVRMGVRRIALVDPDQLQAFNLDATFGTYQSNIGEPKAIAVAKHLHRIRPHCIVHAISKPASDKSVVDQARRSSLIVTCVDNDEPRRIAAVLANQLLKVHLDIGTIIRSVPSVRSEPTREIAADIRLLLPRSCVACVGGLRDTQPRTDAPQVHEELVGHNQDWQSGGRIGSLATINEIAIGSALQLWLDLLDGSVRQSMWQRLRWENGRGLVVDVGAVAGRPDCPICGTSTRPLRRA